MAAENQVDNLKGALLLMIASLGYVFLSALVKMAGQNLPVTQILFIRQLVMGAMLIPLLSKGSLALFKTDQFSLHVFRVFLALVTMTASFAALVHLPLADATAISFSKSFFATIFAVLLLNEVAGFSRWASVLVGFVGVVVMVNPGAEEFSVYSILAVVGAASGGILMVVIRKLTRTDSTSTIIIYQAIGLGVIMAIPAYIYWVSPTLTEWLLLVAIGMVSYFSQKVNILAYKYGEASLLAPLEYIKLLYAAILGWFLFSEFPGVSTWVGAAIIIASSFYVIYCERKINN